MSVGNLDQATQKRISSQLPKVEELALMTLPLNPDTISTKFKPDSSIPIAAICLQDTFLILQEVRIALHEALAHKIWYSEIIEPNDEDSSVFFGRFFFDDAALRLYSAAEYLAEAIVSMLQISKDDLESFAKKRSSRQSILGKYLIKNKQEHSLTKSILKLVNSVEWTETMRYRDEWVHNQPRIIEGFRKFKRAPRWVYSEADDTYKLGIGMGDEAAITIEELQENTLQASIIFTATTKEVVQFYMSILNQHGITLKNDDASSGELTVKLI